MSAFPEHEAVLNIPVRELLDRFPCLVYVFIEQHLVCIGCSFSRFHSLNQALILHNINRERSDKIKFEVMKFFEQHSISHTQA